MAGHVFGCAWPFLVYRQVGMWKRVALMKSARGGVSNGNALTGALQTDAKRS
jgi:hypothetical protein